MRLIFKAWMAGQSVDGLRRFEKRWDRFNSKPDYLHYYARLAQELGLIERLKNACALMVGDGLHGYFATQTLKRFDGQHKAAPLPVTKARHLAICGTSYCGSTLLERILNGRSGLKSVGETNRFGIKKIDGVLYGADFSKPFDQHDFVCQFCGDDCPVLTQKFRAQISAEPTNWYAKIAHQLGTQHLVSSDKSIIKYLSLDPLLRFDALILYKSPLQAWWSEYRKRDDRNRTLKSAQAYVDDWVARYTEMIDDFQPLGQKLYLNFEHFLESPQSDLSLLLAHMGLPEDKTPLETMVLGHAIGGNRFAWDAFRADDFKLTLKPLSAPPLPTDQIALIEAHKAANALYARLNNLELRHFSPKPPKPYVPKPVSDADLTPEPMQFTMPPFDIVGVPPEHRDGIFQDFEQNINLALDDLDPMDEAEGVKHRVYEYILQTYSPQAFTELQRVFLGANLPQTGNLNYFKYFDTAHWLDPMIERFMHLQWHKAAPFRVLDLSAGAGHLLLCAKAFGHETKGFDTAALPFNGGPKQHVYDALCNFWGVNKAHLPALEAIKAYRGPRFDRVVSFMPRFAANSDRSPWGASEWQEFIHQVRENVLTPDGAFVLQYSPKKDTEIYDVFQSAAKSIDARFGLYYF